MLYDYLVYIYHVHHLFPTEVIQILPSYFIHIFIEEGCNLEPFYLPCLFFIEY